ncbi:hypothetical protein MASR2M8_12950 [Opitutaceae bacterium]
MPTSTTAREWDQIRAAFSTSIMVDTSLSSLAQNLEGPDWPLKAKDETPAKYIDLGFDEVAALLAQQGQSAERFDLLVSILKETLAFDDPFGDMVTQAQEAATRDNPLLKNLARLGIPVDFPVALSALSAGTQDFCRREKLSTVSELAVFAQGMAQSVIMGGDFRTLLNALSHVDEPAIAQFLPFRPGERGLHWIEAIAQALRAAPLEQRMALARKEALPIEPLAGALRARAEYFAVEVADLRQQSANGLDLARAVQVLKDPTIEPLVIAELTRRLGVTGTTAATPARRGLMGALSRLFGK